MGEMRFSPKPILPFHPLGSVAGHRHPHSFAQEPTQREFNAYKCHYFSSFQGTEGIAPTFSPSSFRFFMRRGRVAAHGAPSTSSLFVHHTDAVSPSYYGIQRAEAENLPPSFSGSDWRLLLPAAATGEPSSSISISIIGFFLYFLQFRRIDLSNPVAEYCKNFELCRLTEQVVFSDPYKVSQYNHWTSPYLDYDAEKLREDDILKLEVADLKSMFCERAQALIHGDLHTSSVMVTSESTQVIDPEFAFYGPMGFDIGALLGNLILAFFSQDGHADHGNDRTTFKQWILKTIKDTWNLFRKKFIFFWNEHRDGNGEAYLADIYKKPDLWFLVQEKYLKDLFHDSLGFGAAKMIRRIVGVVHADDFESISDPERRAYCEHRALEFAKMLLKDRRQFVIIEQVILAIQNFPS